MAKTFPPFPEMDFSKFMAELKLPSIDVNALTTSYRKNVEAMTAAAQVAGEGMQAVVKRQAEILREQVEEYAQLMRDFGTPASAEEAAAKQAELAKHSFETALVHLRELTQMIAKANSESLEVLNKRVSEMLEELKALTAKKKGKAA
jgi:phasin family protein